MPLIPAVLSDGSACKTLGRKTFMAAVLDGFCPRFTPGGTLLALEDRGNSSAYFDKAALQRLGIVLPERRKLPNAVIYHARGLVLVEAASIHGPISPGRHNELKELFGGSKQNLLFVTAFPTRKEMAKHLCDIAWETEVWLAETPSHLIHFDGGRLLGPYR